MQTISLSFQRLQTISSSMDRWTLIGMLNRTLMHEFLTASMKECWALGG